MSLRFRKSMKLLPGVRLNFSKSTVGLSFGIPGFRYTVNSKGRRTVSAGIPGTGLYKVETLSSGKKSKGKPGRPSTRSTSGIGPPAPGMLAKESEKELYKFLREIYDSNNPVTASAVISKAKKLRNEHGELRYSLELISFLHGITDQEIKIEAIQWGSGIWKNRKVMFADKLVKKYFVGIFPMVTISPGIETELPYNEQTLGFIWAEVLQGKGNFDEALEVLHEMSPDQMVAISVADIEISKGDFDGAIETSDNVEVIDDATAMLMVLRGVAFRGKGMHEAAVECFKRALSNRSIEAILKHRALFERGVTYAAMDKKAMAVKDLEKILVDNPDYPEVEKKLAEIKRG